MCWSRGGSAGEGKRGEGMENGPESQGLVTHWNRMSSFLLFPHGFSVRLGEE